MEKNYATVAVLALSCSAIVMISIFIFGTNDKSITACPLTPPEQNITVSTRTVSVPAACSYEVLNDCVQQYQLARKFGDCVNNPQYCKVLQ